VAKKKDLKRLVILDTHAILHRAYHALPDFSSSRGEPTGALYGLISMLTRIVTDLKPDYIAACYDLPGGTFRHAAYEAYKGTRAKAEDDLVHQIKRAHDVLQAFGVQGYQAAGFEADDCIGTIVEQLKKKKDIEIIIASGDMDTLQLVQGERVRVFTLRKGLTDVVMYDEDAVRERFGFAPAAVADLKGIAGDASDNIKGVKGVGEGSALKLLATYGDLKGLYAAIKKSGVERVAEEAGVQKRFVQLVADNKKEAEFSKELATIHRNAPITFALPKEEWREGVEVERLLDLMAELDFRSLMPRVKQLFAAEKQPAPGYAVSSADETAEVLAPSRSQPPSAGSSPSLLEATLPAEEFDELALMAWVIDSNLTEPALDDIYRLAKAKEPAAARAALEAEIKKRGLSFVWDKIERPLMPVLRAMERRGVKVDRAFLQKLSTEYHAQLDAIAARIYKTAGGEFNLNSPKQLGDVLFDTLGLSAKKKTAGGQRSTRESELQKLSGQHPIIEDILAYRELSKLLGTYIDTIPTLLDPSDRLHTHYVQTGTTTGRLSSQDPNLQNIPIKSDLGRRIRHAFVADAGHTLVTFDYSQIELRIAAILSGDPGLLEIFRAGRDVHAEVAARVFGEHSPLPAHEQRRRAKVINFGILYGMGVTALQQNLGTNRAEASDFYEQYFNAFPRLRDYIEETKADAAREGYTQTLFGRRRYLEGIHSPIPYVRAAAERMAINAPIQGTQADLIKLAMIDIHAYLEKEKTGHLLLQVHDELVFEIEDTQVDACVPVIKRMMEEVFPADKARNVPIVVEGKKGKNWGEMEKL
jgi:DNA polymerase-1